MGGTRVWSLAVGASLALTGLGSTSSAQLQPRSDATKATGARGANAAQDDTKAAAAGGNRNPMPAFMTSPTARLRMLRQIIGVGGGMGGFGGRGGPGGPGGQGNNGPSTSGIINLLLQAPALQEEIKLSEAQKDALKKLNDNANTKRREFFAQMRGNNAGGPGAGGPGGGGPGANNGGGRGNRGNNGGPGGGGPGGPGGNDGGGFGGPGGGPGGQAGPGGQGGRGGNNGPGGGRFGNMDFTAMQEMNEQVNQTIEAGAGKILTKAQKKRLNEIALQIEGVQAVGRMEIAEKIAMNEVQLQEVQAILEEMRNAQGELQRKRMEEMRATFGFGRGGPGGNNGGPGGPGGNNANTGAQGGRTTRNQPQPANADGEEEDAQQQPANARNQNGGRGNRPDPNSPEGQAARKKMEESMARANEESDVIEKKGESAISKVLTRPQKAAFNRMLGAKYDLTKIEVQFGRGFGGPGGPGGPGGNNGGPGGRGGRNNGGAAAGKTSQDDA